MKFHIPSFQELTEIPKNVIPMWNAFGTLVENLKTAFSNGISLADNVDHAVITSRITHGKVIEIPHALKRVPRAVIPVGGRIEFCEIFALDSTKITVKAKLYSTFGSSLALNTMTDRITTESPFLRKGDSIAVNGSVVTVVRVGGNTLTLDRPVVGKANLSVNLLTENITFLLL